MSQPKTQEKDELSAKAGEDVTLLLLLAKKSWRSIKQARKTGRKRRRREKVRTLKGEGEEKLVQLAKHSEEDVELLAAPTGQIDP